MKIQRNDTVQVIAGKDKGKRGVVKRVIPLENRLVVEGINMVKRHVRPQGGQPGQVVEKEAMIHVSNVAIWSETEGRAIRVGYQVQDGKKIRVDRKTGTALDA